MKGLKGFMGGANMTRFSNRTVSANRQYDDFEATELYCPTCKMALPVRKSLLLVLPDGELYEYRCVRCGTSVGNKTEKNKQHGIILT